jgi:uncharacterized protein involved in outer membrane biogenesis
MLKRLKRAAGALLFALVLYSLLGFLIVPGIALRVANQQLSAISTLPVGLERLQFNPFRLELNLWGLHLGEPGQEQLAFERLYANLQLDSLWSGTLHLAAVELEKAHVEVRLDKAGDLNLTQLLQLPPSTAQPPGTSPSEPLMLRIERLALIDSSLNFTDLRPAEPIALVYDSLNFELLNLSTRPDNQAQMTLVASGPDSGRIDWSGSLSLLPLTSTGRLKIGDSTLKNLWPYVRAAVPMELEKGVLSLATDYRLNLAEELQLELLNTSLSLAPLAINAPDGRPLLRLKRLDISEATLNLAKQQVVIGKVRSKGLETWVAREADGQLDWQKLLGTTASAAQAAAGPAANAVMPGKATSANNDSAPLRATDTSANVAAQAPPAVAKAKARAAKTASSAWQVRLRDVQLRDYQLHLTDRVPEQPVSLELGPLNLDLQDFDSLGNSPFSLQLDTGVGKQGRLEAQGQVQLSPPQATLNVVTRNIDMRLAQAYLSPLLHLELRSGTLGSDLNVALSSVEPLAFSVTGHAQVSQLHSLDTLKDRDFLRWQQLDLDGLNYQHGASLSIDKVRLDQPYVRFIINEDLTTNLNDLLIAQAPEAPVTPAAAPEEQAATEPATQPLAIHIGEVSLKDGSAHFADFSLTPDFATAIQQLNGRIGSIDSRQATPTGVDIQGKVDRYAPMSIKGTLNPFDPLDSLDITTRFQNVELTTLTPYSGKFAGYRIRQGRLNLELIYRIENGQLNAQNKVLLENLQLGERVDSSSAVDLPIRLAVALLKDSQGRIAVELPISGDLNNPQFSVLPIVWQTLRNLLLRAVQAPFKFIGGLVSGGAQVDLSNVRFAAGSEQLDAQAQSSLDLLAKALDERPALRLEIEGSSAQSSDGPLLAEQRLEREYQRIFYKILQRRGDAVPAEASQLQVPEDEKASLLDALYRRFLKQQPPAAWSELPDEARSNRLRQALLETWSQSPLMLRKLAQARAASIKDYLVDHGELQDQRIYLLDTRIEQADSDGRVSTQLHLGSQ